MLFNEQVGKETASKHSQITPLATYGMICNEDSRKISLVIDIWDKKSSQSLSNLLLLQELN